MPVCGSVFMTNLVSQTGGPRGVLERAEQMPLLAGDRKAAGTTMYTT